MKPLRQPPKATVYVNKESDWQTLPHNPLVQRNKVTGMHRTLDLAALANLRMKAKGTP